MAKSKWYCLNRIRIQQKAHDFHFLGFQVNLSTKKEFQASLERCTNPKFSSENGEAGKSCLKPKATSSALETKNIVDLKNTMKKVDEIEFLEEIQKVSLPKEVTKSQSRNEKVDEETSIGVLEAAILEKLTTHKHTVPKDPVADPQLVNLRFIKKLPKQNSQQQKVLKFR